MKNVDEKLAETQQKFQIFYNEKLREIYADLEEKRQENLCCLGMNILMIICVAGIFAALFYFNILTQRVLQQKWFGLLIGILIMIAGWMVYFPFQRYNGQTKSRTMNKILSFWGRFRYYNGKDLIGHSTVEKSELFSYFTKSQSEDAFWGHYKDAELDVSEHDLRIEGRKGDIIIFKGVIIKLDFPQDFKGKTVAYNKWRKINLLWNNWLLTIIASILLFFPVVEAVRLCLTQSYFYP